MPMVSPGKTGLVSWWSLNEASGTRNDSHGANHMTVGGGAPGSAAGKQSNGVDLEAGTSDYLTCASPSGLASGAFTVAGWYYCESQTSAGLLQCALTASGGFNIRTLAPGSSGLQLNVRVGGTTWNLSVVSFLSAGSWFFMYAKHDGINTVYAGRNDVAPSSLNVGGPFVAGSGAWNIGGAVSFFQDGILDEWCLYNRSLSADEISWLYNAGAGRAYSELGSPAPLLFAEQMRSLQ